MQYIVMHDYVSGKIRAFYPDLPGNAEQTAQYEAAGLTSKIVDQQPDDIATMWVNPSTNSFEPWPPLLSKLAAKMKAIFLVAANGITELYGRHRRC